MASKAKGEKAHRPTPSDSVAAASAGIQLPAVQNGELQQVKVKRLQEVHCRTFSTSVAFLDSTELCQIGRCCGDS